MIRNFTTVLFINFLLSVTIVSFGQTEKGNMLLGGGIDLSNTKFDNDDFNQRETFVLSLNPSISYLVIDNFAIGVNIPFSYSKLSIDGNDARRSSNVSIGPKVRYYFDFDRIAVFTEMSYSVGSGEVEMTFIDVLSGEKNAITEKYSSSIFDAGLGLSYFLNKNIALESIFSYNQRKTNYDNDSFSNSDSDQSSISLKIGMQVYLQTRKE